MAGLDLARVALHDLDVLDGKLKRVGGDLRQHRRMAVALTHRAGEERRLAARVDVDARALPAAAVEADEGAAPRGAMPHISV